MSSELIYSIDLKRDSATARFYLWLYEASPNDINSCKLFWALILAPFLIVPILLVKSLGGLLDRWEKNHPPKFKSVKPYKSREEKLDSFSSRASATYAKYQTAFRIAGATIGILLALAILSGLAYLFIAYTVKTLIVFAWVVGVILIAGLCIFLAFFFSNGKGQGFARLIANLFRSFHQHTCAKVDLQ